MEPIYAVILAGDNEDRRVRHGQVIANKAFLPINDREMLQYVLDCYRKVDELAGVTVIGPQDKLRSLGADFSIIPQRGNMIANVCAAAEHLSGWLLFSSCDIPLVTPEAVRDFLARCRDADLFYPLVTRADNERVFPGVRRTYVTLREGTFTGGNVLMIHSEKVAAAAPAAEKFFAARKSPFQLAGLIGMGTLLKLMAKRLSVYEIEEKMGAILGVRCKAVISSYPELGTDVDKESDYNAVSSKMGCLAK